MLKQGRYIWRHNSVLAYIFSLFKNMGDTQVLADLGRNHKDSVSTVSSELIHSAQRPHLVIIFWHNIKKICIVEITIPFDTDIQDARQRKQQICQPCKKSL